MIPGSSSYNRLRALRQEFLSPLTKLERLILTGNPLPDVTGDVFDALTTMTILETDSYKFCCISPPSVKTLATQCKHKNTSHSTPQPTRCGRQTTPRQATQCKQQTTSDRRPQCEYRLTPHAGHPVRRLQTTQCGRQKTPHSTP